MKPDETPREHKGGLAVLWLVFLVALLIVVVYWFLSAELPCGENTVCPGPPSLAHKLSYLIIGAMLVLVGATTQRRGDVLYGALFWMTGTVLVVYGVLITIQPTH